MKPKPDPRSHTWKIRRGLLLALVVVAGLGADGAGGGGCNPEPGPPLFGDQPGGDHNFKVRAGKDLFKTWRWIVADQSVGRPIIVRRFRGEQPINIQMTYEIEESLPGWTFRLSQRSFTLGAAPTRFTPDVDDPGARPLRIGDGDIDDADLAAFEEYFTGSGNILAPDKSRVGNLFDMDGDLDVDNADRVAVQALYTGSRPVDSWNKELTFTASANASVPEGQTARVRVTATDTDSGEAHHTFVYITKQSYQPKLELREYVEATVEQGVHLAKARDDIDFDFRAYNTGGRADDMTFSVDPSPPGWAFQFKNIFNANIQNPYSFSEGSIDDFSGLQGNTLAFTLKATAPESWAGPEQEFDVVLRSNASGKESRVTVKVIKGYPLWNISDLSIPGGRRHLVRADSNTTYGLFVTNSAAQTRELSLSASPEAGRGGSSWTASFQDATPTLAAGETRFLYMKLHAPAGASVGDTSDWQVSLRDASTQELLATNLVGAKVTNLHKVIYLAMDGLTPAYADLNAAATGPGSEGDWLMPNVRAYRDHATTYTSATSGFPHYTDPNHVAAISGTRAGPAGIASVSFFYFGKTKDSEAIAISSEDIGAELLHWGPTGGEVLTLFDVAKALDPDAHTVFTTGKRWVPYYIERNIDAIVHGRVLQPYMTQPEAYTMGDTPIDDDDPFYPDPTTPNWGLLPGYFPDDTWLMEESLLQLISEDPDVAYILLAAADDSGHLVGGAADPAEWLTNGTSTFLDDVSTINPRADRESLIDIIREADRLFGHLIETLEMKGTLDETYFVFTSDHSETTHRARLLDLQKLLEAEGGYSYKDDFETLAGTSGAIIFGVADEEKENFENFLENAPSIAPGLAQNPWVVLNRSEMQTGFDVKTGRQMAPPGQLYNEYLVAAAENDTSLPNWPDFYLACDDLWQTVPLNLHNGEDSFGSVFIGGHSGPETAPIPLMISGPGIPTGQVIATPVEIFDIAPTIYALTGWPVPVNSQGTVLPGIPTPRRSSGGTISGGPNPPTGETPEKLRSMGYMECLTSDEGITTCPPVY